jgi:hypothetical protein
MWHKFWCIRLTTAAPLPMAVCRRVGMLATWGCYATAWNASGGCQILQESTSWDEISHLWFETMRLFQIILVNSHMAPHILDPNPPFQ